MKNRFLLTILAYFLISVAYAQPANDALCSAIDLTENGGCTSGTNVGATNVNSNPTCWATVASNDVWYSFVATSAAMTISTDYGSSGTLTNSQLALYSSNNGACTGTLTQIACDEDGGVVCALCAEMKYTTLTVGTTYYVRVDGYSTNVGTFCIGAFDTPLANELTGTTCALATIVTSNSLACSAANGNSAYNYNSGTATGGPTPLVGTDYAGCDNETSQYGNWSTFTANSATTTIQNLTAGANQETLDFTIFTGSCKALTAVNCYGVASGGSVSFSTTVGTKYFVLTTLQGGSTAGFRSDHCIKSNVGCTPPANDNCASAQVVTANTAYQVTNYCATADGNLCAGSNENNIWFTWTAPAGWTGPTYFQLFDQNCRRGHASSGMQVSVYSASLTCATATACVASANPVDDEDITLGWTSTPGQTYLMTFDGYGGEVCAMKFAITDVVTTILLPVELVSFSANKNGNSVNIDWSTASETKNKSFIVEKSQDAVAFQPFAEVAGAGSSTQVLKYSTIDYNPYEGTSYYRLKQVDFDGKFKYSEIVSVDNGSDTELNFDIVPNPNVDYVSTNIVFSRTPKKMIKVSIFDLNGVIVYEELKKMDSNKYEIPNQFSKGVYIIKVLNDDVVLTKRMLIK